MVLQLLNLLSFTQIFSSVFHAYIDLYMRDKSLVTCILNLASVEDSSSMEGLPENLFQLKTI